MIVRHATPMRNLPGIKRHGLLTRKSKCKRPLIWFHSPSRSSWAILHVAKRHKVLAETVAILEIRVPRSWVRRSSRRGLLVCSRDVPAWRIKRLVCLEEIAA